MNWKSESSNAALKSHHVILFWGFNTFYQQLASLPFVDAEFGNYSLKYVFGVPLAFSPSLFILQTGTWSCPSLQCKPAQGGMWGEGKSPKSLGIEGQLSVPEVLLSSSADGLRL